MTDLNIVSDRELARSRRTDNTDSDPIIRFCRKKGFSLLSELLDTSLQLISGSLFGDSLSLFCLVSFQGRSISSRHITRDTHVPFIFQRM